MIMRPQTPFPENTAERMKELLSSTRSVDEFKRIQSVYLRAEYSYSASQIANMVDLKLQTVKNIHAAYLKHGEAALKLSNPKSRGGRNRFYLTVEQEKYFLAQFEPQGKSGSILEISKVHVALEKQLDKSLPKSTTYRMLYRHGWRKLAPRPSPPKGDKDTQERFKKTLAKLFPMLKN